jgi:DDE superfamily endonuclease
VFLPPYSPELNPIERLWLHLRDNRLSHRVFRTTDEIIDSCCDARNWLRAETGRIRRCAPIPGSYGSLISQAGITTGILRPARVGSDRFLIGFWSCRKVTAALATQRRS